VANIGEPASYLSQANSYNGTDRERKDAKKLPDENIPSKLVQLEREIQGSLTFRTKVLKYSPTRLSQADSYSVRESSKTTTVLEYFEEFPDAPTEYFKWSTTYK
jgi:hypothetical protein